MSPPPEVIIQSGEDYFFPDPSQLTFQDPSRCDEDEIVMQEQCDGTEHVKSCIVNSCKNLENDENSSNLKIKDETTPKRKKSLTWSEDTPEVKTPEIEENPDKGNHHNSSKGHRKNSSDYRYSKMKSKKDSNVDGLVHLKHSSLHSNRKNSSSSECSSRRGSSYESSTSRKNSYASNSSRKGSYSLEERKGSYQWENGNRKQSLSESMGRSRSLSHCSQLSSRKNSQSYEANGRRTTRGSESRKGSRRFTKEEAEEESLLGYDVPTDVTLSSIINHIAYMNQASSSSKISSKLKASRRKQVKQVTLIFP